MSEPMILTQARIGLRARLPRKVLANIWGKTMLERQHARQEVSKIPTAYVIPAGAGDDELAEFMEERSWCYFRGPEDDVLRRYAQAAHFFDADPIIRTTADCPLIDPGVLRGLLKAHDRPSRLKFTTNSIEKTFPHGLDAEVFDRELLELANVEATTPFEREHVSPWMRVNTKIVDVVNVTSGEALGSIRITVDTQADRERIREIYRAFRDHAFITTADVVWLHGRRPDLSPEW